MNCTDCRAVVELYYSCTTTAVWAGVQYVQYVQLYEQVLPTLQSECHRWHHPLHWKYCPVFATRDSIVIHCSYCHLRQLHCKPGQIQGWLWLMPLVGQWSLCSISLSTSGIFLAALYRCIARVQAGWLSDCTTDWIHWPTAGWPDLGQLSPHSWEIAGIVWGQQRIL